MGSKKSSTKQSTDARSDIQSFESTSKQNFSTPESKQNYNDFLNASKNNYNNSLNFQNGIWNDYASGRHFGDDSYFKQAWGQAQGIDQSGLNKMNTMSWNPNDNADWVKANNDIDKNARLGWGQYNNQLNQNMIGTGMANGSGHQTAAYKQSALLNSQLAADRASRWQQQYNQNMQNQLAANNQLGNFYTTLSNIGLDYAKLTQQDLTTLLNAYNQQSDLQSNALRTWGQAVEMGSDPTVTTQGRQTGEQHSNSTSESKQSSGFGGILGTVAGVMPWGSIFGGSSKG